MDCFASDSKRRHEYFIKMVNKKNTEMKNIHRIILIGTGESGKSTFVKQMKLLSSQNQTFPDNYRAKFVPEIQRNLVQALHFILQFMNQENIKFADKSEQITKAEKAIFFIKNEIDRVPDSITQFAGHINPTATKDFYDACSLLWNDAVVKETALRGNEFQLIDCASYFLNNLDEISRPNYKPTDDDVLQCRTKTLGIHTESIIFNNVHFELVDVGGQREQRAKWIEAMSDGVTAVIFLTDVSSYDMMLAEDNTVNRLRESINLLGQVWTKNPLKDKSIILFLNKQDKLDDKVRFQRTSIEDYFPEFKLGKLKCIIELIKDLKAARTKKLKKEGDVWDKFFSYFLPTNRSPSAKAQLNTPEENKLFARDAILLNEYSQIQSLINKVFSDNSVNTWPIETGKFEEIANNLLQKEDFNAFYRRLSTIPFFQIVVITYFIQDLFVVQCEQTVTRHVYPFPTMAIDKRNVDRVFDSCKDILQGKALTELMV